MGSGIRGSKRGRGEIEDLASGALRVKVYAGIDPISKKRLYLRETVSAGPNARRQAEMVRTRLLNEVYERRNPRTDATVAQLIDRHIAEAKLGIKTRINYRSQADKHIVPCIGDEKVRAVDAALTDSFYVELRRCREHCDGRSRIDHRTAAAHDCDERCRPHACRPLKEASVLYIHQILSGAFRRAVRLRWVSVNPFDTAEPPPAPRPKPRPPTAVEAARIVTEAWKDPDWGTLIWLTMVAGNRRGELCAIRWRHVDLINGVLHIERAIGQYAGRTWEKDTKSDADRRIVVDRETVLLLNEHRERCVLRARAIGVELADNAFVFSRHPAGATHLRPDGLTQRYARLATRLGIRTSIHKLRAYNATELIAAGVDIRTVAGRLGHGSGGATTLRSYTAWVSEADQRAAGELAARMPTRPRSATRPVHVEIDARYTFEKLAVGLRDRIYAGELAAGLPIPSVKQLARQHTVSTSTAQRAVKLLSQWGLVRVERGRPTLVTPLAMQAADLSAGDRTQSGGVDDLSTNRALEPRPEALDLEVRHLGQALSKLKTVADPTDSNQLRQLLVDAIRRTGADESAIGDYELVVRYAGERGILTTFVAATTSRPQLRSVDSSSA